MRPSRTGSPRVVGFMQARNQWPLVGVSVTHALANHVDRLTVLLHRTTDDSARGLAMMREIWGDRLTVLAHEAEEFLQEATTNSMIAASGVSGDCWVYVLDADEFLLTPWDRTLGDVLADRAPGVDGVRYEVHNWVVPRSMDPARVDDYRGLVQRAVPTLFGDLDDGLRAQEIMEGRINFFDVPFPSKVIVRAGRWVTAGAHSTRGPQAEGAAELLHPDLLRAAHLPYVCRSRFAERALHGESVVRGGFPPGHGWQNQMIRRLDHDGALDSYWQAHTLGEPPPGRIAPLTAQDDDLARALAPSLETLVDQFGPELRVPGAMQTEVGGQATTPASVGAPPATPVSVGAPPATPASVGAPPATPAPPVPFDALVGVARRAQLLYDSHEAALQCSARLAVEKEAVEARLAESEAQVDAFRAELRAAEAERARMRDEGVATAQELALAREESERAVEALAALVASKSWRVTAGLRRATQAVRARRASP